MVYIFQSDKNNNILPIVNTLVGSITPSQSKQVSNDKEEVFHLSSSPKTELQSFVRVFPRSNRLH